MNSSDGTTLATVTITKMLGEDDVYIFVDASAIEGESLPLIEVLGMIELGKDTFIRQAMGEDE